MSEPKNVSKLHNLSFYSLIIGIVSLSLFFIPGLAVPLGVSKGFIFAFFIAFSFIFWLLDRLIDGKFVVPGDWILVGTFVLPLVFLVASFFSPNLQLSFFGYGFEIGTFTNILVLCVSLFLSAIHFQDNKKISYFFLTLFGSFVIVQLFGLVSIFTNITNIFPNFFAELSSMNLIGSWNDFASYSGLIIILSLLALELLPLTKVLRFVLWSSVVVSTFFLAVVNFFSIWMIVGLVALFIFVYSLSVSSSKEKGESITKRSFPVASFAVVIVCLSFLTANNFFGGVLPNYFEVSNIEVRPSAGGTIDIAKNTLSNNPFFGSGPNFFGQEWLKFKSEGINSTIFWDTGFGTGFNILLTFLVTTGIIGIISLISFMVYFFYKGIISSVFSSQDKLSSFFSFGSFAMALYLWILSFAYVPNIVIFSLAFVSTGVFLGVLVNRKDVKTISLSFLKDPRSSFFSILLLVVFLLGAVSMTYSFVKKFASVVAFERGTKIYASEDTDKFQKAEKKLLKSLNLYENDLYYRTISELYFNELRSVISDQSMPEEDMRLRLQDLLSRAEEASRTAVSFNDKNYLNWVSLGLLYESIVPLGVENAYQNGLSAYNQALVYNPESPAILLNLARLEIANGNEAGGRDLISQALAKKPDYLSAYYLLSNMALEKGDTKVAIEEIQKALRVAPNSSDANLRMGVLRFNQNEYASAVSSFERAVILEPSSLDARYLLAIAYERSGNIESARVQLEILKEFLPEDENITSALTKLNEGKPLISETQGAQGLGEDILEEDSEDEE